MNPLELVEVLGREFIINSNNISAEELSAISETDFQKRISDFKNPAIFIGNGVSRHFGSDSWDVLSDSLFDYLEPKYIDDKKTVKKAIGGTTYSTTSMTSFLIKTTKYYEALYYSLYKKYEDNMHIDGTSIRNIVKAKMKYQNMPLITYNYDDFLETDYEKTAFKKMNSVSSSNGLKKKTEPRIIHVHGFYPQKSKRKPKIVLTQEEYFDKYRRSNWVSSVQKKVLSNCTCLFVGSSMSDLYQMSIIHEVNKKHYSQEAKYSWKCFAILCLKDMTVKDIISIYQYYWHKGVNVIAVDGFDKIPDKIKTLFDL